MKPVLKAVAVCALGLLFFVLERVYPMEDRCDRP